MAAWAVRQTFNAAFNPAFSRRELLKQGAILMGSAIPLAAAASTSSQQSASAQQPADKPQPLKNPQTQKDPQAQAEALAAGAIDAHSHIWTLDVRRYPLAAEFSPADMNPKSFTAEELLAQARPCGVTRVVLIQMSYYGFDNSYMLDAMRDFPKVFSGVAVVDSQALGLRDTMVDLKKQGVRGFRIQPPAQGAESWLARPEMAAMWRIGGEEQLAICALTGPEALGALDKMCEKHPATPLVIDHFARIGVDGTLRDSQIDALCRLARHKKTYVKVSAFYALGKKHAPYVDLGPMVRRLLDAFGKERLMWATDCPFQVQGEHTYRDSIELIRGRLDFLTPDDRQWLLRKTAERVFFS